jgi:hypothetical protein
MTDEEPEELKAKIEEICEGKKVENTKPTP